MYAKSFMALDGNGRLTGAITAQTAPYDRYSCHLCASALQYHPEYDTERPCSKAFGERSTALPVCKARGEGDPPYPATAVLCTGSPSPGFLRRLALSRLRQ